MRPRFPGLVPTNYGVAVVLFRNVVGTFDVLYPFDDRVVEEILRLIVKSFVLMIVSLSGWQEFMMVKKSKRAQKVIAQMKAQAGLDRQRYFEEGGEMVRWRGLHQVQRNKKKYTRKSKHKGRCA